MVLQSVILVLKGLVIWCGESQTRRWVAAGCVVRMRLGAGLTVRRRDRLHIFLGALKIDTCIIRHHSTGPIRHHKTLCRRHGLSAPATASLTSASHPHHLQVSVPPASVLLAPYASFFFHRTASPSQRSSHTLPAWHHSLQALYNLVPFTLIISDFRRQPALTSTC